MSMPAAFLKRWARSFSHDGLKTRRPPFRGFLPLSDRSRTRGASMARVARMPHVYYDHANRRHFVERRVPDDVQAILAGASASTSSAIGQPGDSKRAGIRHRESVESRVGRGPARQAGHGPVSGPAPLAGIKSSTPWRWKAIAASCALNCCAASTTPMARRTLRCPPPKPPSGKPGGAAGQPPDAHPILPIR